MAASLSSRFAQTNAWIKGYPFEVLIAGDRPSVVLADKIKSLDWVVRKASHKGKVSPAN